LGDHFESPTGKQLGGVLSNELRQLFGDVPNLGMRLPLLRETRMPALLLRIDDITALVRSHQAMAKIVTDALRQFVEVGLD
jgi:hypothetical protein